MAGRYDSGQTKGVQKRRNWLTVAIVAGAIVLVAFTIRQATRSAKPQGGSPGAPVAKAGGPEPLVITPLANKPQPPAGLATRAEKGSLAPDFTVTDMATGKPVKLSDLRGRPVYINFWATWCPWCKVEMPDIQKVYRARKNDVYVLLVDADSRETQDQIQKFARDNDLTLPQLFDPTGEVANNYLVRALPTSVFIDRRGVITTIYPGALSERQLTQFLDEASR
ncbi:MAG: TlpA family protein disulfide reductase [Symbiobacteriia bacterium]